MKKYADIKKCAAVTLALLVLLLTLSPTLAWFSSYIEINSSEANITGSSAVTYFGSGDGSVDDPYIISSPTHLYNLAWLQYIGYFNLGDINNGRAQTYFALGANIDMSSLAIPPIGTTEYPFIGSFDGGGYVISNLTTANAKSLLEKRPSNSKFKVDELLSEYGGNSAEAGAVIGFFGVVGDYGGELSGLAGVTLSDAEPPADEDASTEAANASTVYTKDIKVINTALSGYTLENGSAATTIGFVAGYVNARVENMLVNNCTLTVASGANSNADITQSISEHTLVGYCEDAYLEKLNDTVIAVSSPTVDELEPFIKESEGDGDAQGWGGSIAMDKLFTNLTAVINQNANITSLGNYKYYDERVFNANGQLINDSAAPKTTTGLYTSNKGTLSNVTINKVTHQSVAVKDYFNVISDPDDTYLYITGGYQNVDRTWVRGEETDAYTIADGNMYMCITDGTLSSVSDGNQAAKWILTADNYLVTEYNGVPYYLNASNNKILSISLEASTKWSKSASGFYYTSGGKSYYIQRTDEEWLVETDSTVTRISFTYDNTVYYLHADGTTLSVTTDINTATLWSVSADTSGTISTNINGTTYYVYYQRSFFGGGSEPSLSTSSTNWQNSDGKLYYEYSFFGTTTYYLSYNGSFSATTSSDSATVFDFTNVTYTIEDLSVNSAKASLLTSTTSPVNLIFNETNSTYIPLQMQTDDAGTCLYIPKDNNTGYITSGSYSKSDGTARDLRVSQYSTGDITTKSVIHIINPDGNGYVEVTISDYENDADYQNAEFVKFKDSIETYKNLINASSQDLYGLHFMKGLIDINSLVTIPKAVVNGSSYENYQVPADCIDFSLKEKGYINFYAGTYYNNNNYFFTLHHIERDTDNKIVSIREIAKIYESITDREATECVYEYTSANANGKKYAVYQDGKYVDIDAPPSDYEMTFNMDWITTALDGWEDDEAYYFEVPASPGEYALGSSAIDGKNGAYLIYLDISANAQTIERKVITEVFTETQNTYEYASGVGIMDGENYAEITDEYISVRLPEDFGSTLSFVRTGDNVSMTDGTSAVLNAASGVTVDGMTPTPISSSVLYTKRVTYIDTNLTTKEVVKFIITRAPDGTVTVTDHDGNDITSSVIVSTDQDITKLKTGRKDDQINWSDITAASSAISYNYSASGEVLNTFVYNYDEKTYEITVQSDDVDVDVTVTELNTSDSFVSATVNGEAATAP